VEVHVLADFRYRAWTRLPGMAEFLDENRVREWERACRIRDGLGKLLFAPPDPEHAPPAGADGRPVPSIHVPEHVLD
jgi:hypothetical protein